MASRLFEAIIDANHRALAGDAQAGLHPADYEEELPLVALTCVDARLNALLPQALGVPPEQFIWLRNAGNIVTGPMSSTMRSLALACAVKGGRQIVIIGHTDCQVAKTTTMELIDRFRALGIDRQALPDNLTEYFGIFSSDRQNVRKGVELVRSSPLIGPRIPVQGLLVDIETGKLEWLVNGYETPGTTGLRWNEVVRAAGSSVDAFKPLADFNFGEMKFPEAKIGELGAALADAISQRVHLAPVASGPQVKIEGRSGQPSEIPLPSGFSLSELKFPEGRIGEVITAIGEQVSQRMHSKPISAPPDKVAPQNSPPPKIPLPPPIRPRMHLRRNPK
jgi:carbonic anhydrase